MTGYPILAATRSASCADSKPREVSLWQATNPKARDFRLESIKAAYKKSPLQPQADGSYLAYVDKPAQGWTAFFAELIFDSGAPEPYKLTTQVHILPDVLPHSFDEFRKATR